ncbi:hypothetical protein B0T17DRAFT_621107 [Bombardia bombarda]|uniref:Uncharacterized protein n=1 Tax=Bombardia bombarda TaxID=252184 RepID=A0AA39W446_9PEZI|nr:hypothetical protein B0T17DRAFT_621107 [Bombardia bombarda]
MRSHPYTAPPPLPPFLDELADELSAILPNQGPRRPRASEDTEVELSELNHDTSRLLPVRQKRHHVRVQGKLVLVRSISTADLRPLPSPLSPLPPLPPMHRATSSSSPSSPVNHGNALPSPAVTTSRYESAVGSSSNRHRPRQKTGGRRRRSYDGGLRDDESWETETETEEEVRETGIRDRQLRGYGIGGAGNIRRPTDVMHFSDRRPGSSIALFSNGLPSSPTWPMLSPASPTTPGRKRWNIREMFGLPDDPKGKRKANSP